MAKAKTQPTEAELRAADMFNPESMGEEVKSTNIPNFVKGIFMLCGYGPSKNKTMNEGIVCRLILLSYYLPDGTQRQLTKISKTEDEQYIVEFPEGKNGLMAIKYRGPKSIYKFKNEETGKWYQIHESKFQYKSFLAWLQSKDPKANTYGDAVLQEKYTAYLMDMYNYGFAQDFGTKFPEVPQPGAVMLMYRRYTEPDKKKNEKYGNINVSKYSGSDNKEEFPPLNGAYQQKPEEMAEAVLAAYLKKDKDDDDTSFGYGANAEGGNNPEMGDVI